MIVRAHRVIADIVIILMIASTKGSCPITVTVVFVVTIIAIAAM